MTGVDKDLATLPRGREFNAWVRIDKPDGSVEFMPLRLDNVLSVGDLEEMARVEAELSRLREEERRLNGYIDQYIQDVGRLREQRDALEARVSVLHAAKDRLLNDLGAAERALTVKENQADACLADAEAAEARCARLQQALTHHGYGPRLCRCANCVAAGPDTPADSHYRERPIEEDFYLDPRGEWVYRWSDERRVLKPADSQEDKT